MDLKDHKRVWEAWARHDPLWAILSDPAKTDGRWDKPEFLATGAAEIAWLISDLSEKGIEVRRGRCLDFGCGVGRLSQALSEVFDRCDGVDISDTMVRQAREWNQHPDRCFYHVNDRPDLSLFSDGSFDLIYSNIVLQHIEPDISERYIREFVRVLGPGGVAVFQVPARDTRPRHELPQGAHRASITLVDHLPALTAGARAEIQVRVRNDSATGWAHLRSLKVGNHWRSADGSTLITVDDGRESLPAALEPGEGATVPLTITAPDEAGRYLLEVDLVEEGICWFADRASPTLRVPVRVAPRRGGLRRRLLGGRQAGEAREVAPRPFGMYGLPRERVVAAVEDSGARLLAVEEYNPSGEGWESFRYYATR